MSSDRFKFRAWDKENKVLHYNAECAYDFMNGTPPLMHDSFGTLLDDDNFIIEQCTGLTDKNGKLIYEGDIITTSFEYETPTEYDTYAIKWCKAYAGELFCSVDARGEPADFYGGIPLVEYCRVIGNIHEMELKK